MNTCDTAAQVCGVPRCVEIHYCTCTHQTHDLKPVGFPVPVTIPKLWIFEDSTHSAGDPTLSLYRVHDFQKVPLNFIWTLGVMKNAEITLSESPWIPHTLHTESLQTSHRLHVETIVNTGGQVHSALLSLAKYSNLQDRITNLVWQTLFPVDNMFSF